MSTDNKKPKKHSTGIDLGTAFLAIALKERSRLIAIESPTDGTQTPTIVVKKGEQEKVGTEALMLGSLETGDVLYMHAKRNLSERPTEKIYGGKYTPVDVLAIILRHARKLILSHSPTFAEYPQFGGSKCPADELAIVVTVPATFGIEQQTHLETAMKEAGFHDFDGFIAEPIAAARRIAHVASVELKNGDTIFVADIGAGTTDFAILKYESGVFDQIAAASGDEFFAGHDFTNALAAEFAKSFRVSWQNVYGKGGFSLSRVSAKRRPDVIACWNAAEDAKKKLSVNSEATVALDFRKGRKTHTISRETADKLYAPLIERLKEAVSKSLDDTDLEFKTLSHIMLAGGSSRDPSIRTAVAEAMGIPQSEIHVCSDSEHIVSMGAAEHGFYQDESSQAMESGLGFVVFDQAAGAHRNLLMVQPGRVIPAKGLLIEQAGFRINTSAGRNQLVCKPFACRTGVRATVVPGRERFMEDSEILPLTPIETAIDRFPDGDHNVKLGIRLSPNRQPELLCCPTELGNVEQLTIPLALSHSQASGHTAPTEKRANNVMLLVDCSTSMQGEKIEMLRRGAKTFATAAQRQGVNVGLIVFPQSEDPYEDDQDNAQVTHKLSDAPANLIKRIDELYVGGSTPVPAALSLAAACLKGKPQPTAVIFTDGQPNDPILAQQEADVVKKDFRLITVGIGHDVDEAFLRGLASSPADYRFAECPEEILTAFDQVAELIWSKSSKTDSTFDRPKSRKKQHKQASQEQAELPPPKPSQSSALPDDPEPYQGTAHDMSWDEFEPTEAPL